MEAGLLPGVRKSVSLSYHAYSRFFIHFTDGTGTLAKAELPRLIIFSGTGHEHNLTNSHCMAAWAECQNPFGAQASWLWTLEKYT